MVVGDEAAVPGAGELVVAYTGGQREWTDDDSSEQAGHRARAVAFEGEPGFERVEDALDPLAHRAQRAVPGGLVAAIGTDQPGAVACDELLECLPERTDALVVARLCGRIASATERAMASTVRGRPGRTHGGFS